VVRGDFGLAAEEVSQMINALRFNGLAVPLTTTFPANFVLLHADATGANSNLFF
jgi:hypothetical protein